MSEPDITLSHHLLNLLWERDPTKAYPFADWLRDKFDEGLTWEQIVEELAGELDGWTITDRTLKSWFPDMRRYVPARKDAA